jgi:hypothetical protein
MVMKNLNNDYPVVPYYFWNGHGGQGQSGNNFSRHLIFLSAAHPAVWTGGKALIYFFC